MPTRLLLLFTTLCTFALPGCKEVPTHPEDALVVVLDTAPKGLDPRFPGGDASAKITGLLHAGLVSVDTPDGQPALELAQSITQKSPTLYEIELKPGLKFHDGHPLTADDVEYTFTQLGSDLVSSPMSGISAQIKSFRIHSPTAFAIELTEPRAPFLVDLALGIVPKHLCEGKKECPAPEVGAGPFSLVSTEGSTQVHLRAFKDYPGGASPINDLVFRVVDDDNTRLISLLGKSVHLVQNAVSPLMLPVVEDLKGYDIHTSKSFKYTYIAFNLRKPKLQDLRVRQALALGIDRRNIIHHKYRDLATPATGMLSPTHWAYEGDVATFDYDPERAKALLDAAGYPDPDGDGPKFRMEIEFKVSSSKFRRALAQLIAHQLARIGVSVRVRAYEWGTFYHDIKTGNFEMTTLQWPSVLEPDLYRWIFHSSNIPSPQNSSAGANRGAYANPKIDALLDQAVAEIDREKRRALYSQIQKILAADLPYISLWHEDNIAIQHTGLKGYAPTPNARFEALKTATWTPK